ncbi:MAG: YncE family protein [Burkholderiales bacterium]
MRSRFCALRILGVNVLSLLRRFLRGAYCAGVLVWVASLAAAQPVAPGDVPASAAALAGPVPSMPPIFVLNSLDASISVIDGEGRAELRRLATGKEPHHLYLSPDEKSLLVANALSDSITLVDPKTGVIQRIMTGIVDPYQLRFSPDMKWFVTAANRLNHVDIYRVTQPPGGGFELALARRVPAGKTPSHINIDTKSTVAYVSLQDSDELIAIDLATQMPRWTVPVGKLPADLYLTADDRTLLIGLTGDAFVEAYDVSGAQPRLIKRIATGDGAHAFRAWGDKRHVLVSNRVANTISRLDTQTLTVTDTYPAPGGPDDMDLSPDRRYIFVASRWARKLTVIDTEAKKVVRQVPVGKSPHGVWTLQHAGRL